MKGKNTEYVKFILTDRGKGPMVGKTTNTAESIPGEDIIRTEDGPRKIKYVPTEVTIFADNHYDKKAAPGRPEFIDGSLLVASTNEILIEFLRKTNYNSGNPDRDPTKASLFNEFKINEISATKLKQEELTMNAEGMLYTMSPERIRSVARLALPSVEFANLEMHPNALKLRLKRWLSAGKHQQFIDLASDPIVDRVEKVVNAEEMGIIAFARSAWWYDNAAGSKIVEVPSSKDKYKFLAEKSFEAVKGDWIVISTALDARLKEGAEEVNPDEVQSPKLAEVLSMGVADFFTALKQNNLVKWDPKGPAFFVIDEEGNQSVNIGKSGDDAAEYVSQNEELRNELRKRLSIKLQK